MVLKEKGKTQGAVIELSRHLVEQARHISRKNIYEERIAAKNTLAIYDKSNDSWQYAKLIQEVLFRSVRKKQKEIAYIIKTGGSFYDWEVGPLISLPLTSLEPKQREGREAICDGASK